MNANQTTRRAVYGLNVAVAVCAAVVIAVLLNWFVDWAYGRLGPGTRPWVRYDLTATRAHTLSPQSKAVLGRLEGPLTLTGLFATEDPQREAVADLLQGYARFSPHVEAEVLNPERDAAALRGLFAQVEEGFAGVLGPEREAIEAGNAQLRLLADAFEREAGAFATAAESLDAGDALTPRLTDLLAVAEADLTQEAAQYRRAVELFSTALDEPLPALGVSRARLLEVLRRVQNGKLPALDRWLRRQAEDRLLPAGVRNTMLVAREHLGGAAPELAAVVTALGRVSEDAAYAQLRESLRAQDCVVVRYGGRVTVVPLGDMYRQGAVSEDAGASAVAPLRFLGEERLTGAVLAVEQREPPMVVIVTGAGRPATGREGRHNMMTQRLQYGGFEVAEWHAVSVDGKAAVTAAPRIAEGRRVVWVVLPFDAANPAASEAKRVVAEAMQERFALGDGVLLVPGFRRDAEFTERDPLIDFASAQGLTAEPGHLVMYETATQQQRRKAEQTFRVSRWPGESPLREAMQERTAWFEFAHPVALGEGTGAAAVVVLEKPGAAEMWVERDPLARGEWSDAQADPGEAVERQVVAGVVDPPGGGRLAVVADDLWLTDTVILRRSAEGNAELLVQAVYWLSGLEDAIAATPRVTVVSRIGPMTQGQRRAVRWGLLAGVPAVVLLAGVAVWWRRQQG